MVSVRVHRGRDVAKGLQLNSKGYIRVYVIDGVHVSPRNGSTMSMVELAKAMAFGTAKNPPRDFINDAVREKLEEINKVVKSSLVWRFKGLTAEVQYGFAANEIAIIVRDFIRQGTYYKATQPNSAKTIEEKGSDIPLLDSGQLVNHIGAEYVNVR